MKTIYRLICAAAFAACVGALSGAETATLTEMPDEVTLTSGRVLRGVQVVRWERDRVVLKYSGGVDPIAFSLFKQPAPADVAALRDAAKKTEKKVSAPTSRTITGQVFVTTRGAGAYKFAGAQVLALPLSALSGIQSSVENDVYNAKLKAGLHGNSDPDYVRYSGWGEAVKNVQPIAAGSTDADGLFHITISSKEPVFIYCATYRSVGGSHEYNVWAVPLEKSDRMDLNGSNQL